MAEWFKTEELRPLADNTHGRVRCITYWNVHKLDDDGNQTDEVERGVQHIVDYFTVGNGGRFEDPDCAEAIGEWFGDDCEYAPQPSHWALCIANPDGSEIKSEISHVDGKPVDRAA